MKTVRRAANFLLVCSFPLGYSACSGKAEDDSNTGGATSTSGGGGHYVLGGSPGMGGKIVIPIGAGGKGVTSGGGSSGGSGASSGGQEGSLAVCDLPLGPSVGNPAENLVLDDFEDGDATYEGNGLLGSWFGYTDDSGGTQTPTGDQMVPESGGPSGQGYALHVAGERFNSWGSGIAGPLAYPGSSACLFDASAYRGISFWARGEIGPDPGFESPDGGGAYDPGAGRLLVIEKDVVPLAEGGNCDDAYGACWDSHRALFKPTTCWTQYVFRFEDLLTAGFGFPGGKLDLDELVNVNFEFGRGNRYDIWIDEIRFFVDDPAPQEPICDVAMGGAGNVP